MHRGEVRRHLGAVTPVNRQADAPPPGEMEAELRPSQLSRHASRARFICLAARSPPLWDLKREVLSRRAALMVACVGGARGS